MINQHSGFTEDSLQNLSIVKCAIGILENTVDDIISQADLVKVISSITGRSIASVNGTLWGGDLTPRAHKLMGTPYFKTEWFPVRVKGRKLLVRTAAKTDFKPIKECAYDDPIKQEARRQGAEKCLRKCKSKNPKILTMASEEGYDVKRFKEINPNCIIYNAESNRAVLNNIESKKLPMTSYFGDMYDCLRQFPDRYLDIINYDTDGYPCESLDKALRTINDRCLTTYLCLTVQKLTKFRNHGTWADNCREMYKHHDDPVLAYFKLGPLTNYKIEQIFCYNRTAEKAKGMMIITFKLLPHCLTKIEDDDIIIF